MSYLTIFIIIIIVFIIITIISYFSTIDESNNTFIHGDSIKRAILAPKTPIRTVTPQDLNSVIKSNSDLSSIKKSNINSIKNTIYPKSPKPDLYFIDGEIYTIIDDQEDTIVSEKISVKAIKEVTLVKNNFPFDFTLKKEKGIPKKFPTMLKDETNTFTIDECYIENGILKSHKRKYVKRYPKESYGECIARHVLEDIYKVPFDMVHPDFLSHPTVYNNPDGTTKTVYRNLELDGWSPLLKIGFEYNGKQHYEQVDVFQKTEEAYIKQLEHDKWKYNRMVELGYYLITIPCTVHHNMIRLFIEYYLPENVSKRENEKV